jgi:phospholipid transport system substrate-binding protein
MNKAIGLAMAFALTAQVATAQVADPATGTVKVLQDGLLSIMHAGGKAGVAGRSKMIAPVIDNSFDIPLMTRLAVGPPWTGFSAGDQQAAIAGFRSLTIAQFAKNFDGFSGQHFEITPQVQTRGADKLVLTKLVSSGGSSEALNYRLRQSGGKWKIIDVYYRNSISQLATRRSDFATVLKKGGAQALLGHLNRLTANPD